MTSEIYYYLVIDHHPFAVIMKKTDVGWYWADTILRQLNPSYYGKSKPKMNGETYILTKDWGVAQKFIERQLAEWKQEMMDDFHLNRTASDYLKALREYNKEVFHQYYLTVDDELIYMRTLLNKDRSWRQEIAILGEKIFRKSWHDNDNGSEEPMNCPGPKMRPITTEIARYKAEIFIDGWIEKRYKAIKEFCEVC